MHAVLFVCHGNICRSPMAEMVMKDLVRRAGREDDFSIDSAAARPDAIGCGIHRGTRDVLQKYAVPFTEHYARLAARADYARFDLIVCMDDENVDDLHDLFGGDPSGKVRKLLSFCGMTRDVADPWYTHNFEDTYRDIVQGCSALLKTLP
ncbi:MAG: low molecular weight phosphotyrosine protein phosphatase [Treponemataceae bacterium]|nr:low molecular weight phosphotyrosine protein phosphatase [Treponemataceae bacterium]